jgi:integrase
MEKHWVIDEECFVTPRGGKYQAHYMIKGTGKVRRQTTGESDLEKAKDAAKKRYREIVGLQERGVTVHSTGKLVHYFNDVAKKQRQYWIDGINSGTGTPIHHSYIQIMDKWLLPFFKDIPIADVDDDLIFDFEEHRKKELGREPGKTTINSHNCVFRAIYDMAVRKKFVQSSQVPIFTVRNKGVESNPRGKFTPDEMAEIESQLFIWREDHPKFSSRYLAKLTYYYVKLLVTSGIRPGKEIGLLQWKHVDENYFNEPDGLHYIKLNMPHRKTSKGKAAGYILLSKDLINTCFADLKKLTRRTEPDDYLFCDMDGAPAKSFSERFRHFLEEKGMRYQNEDLLKGRSLYSMRHFYATQRIIKEKVPREILASHMATSVGMLHEFYFEAEKGANASLTAPSIVAIDHSVDVGENGFKPLSHDMTVINEIMAMKSVDDAAKLKMIAAITG